MASNQNQNFFHCNGCNRELNYESKTLPCLHSFCSSCLETNVEAQTSGSGECSECNEYFALHRLNLSPIFAKSLRCRQLEDNDWKCDLCPDDGTKSDVQYCCLECQILFCTKCCRIHQELSEHSIRDLDGMKRKEAIEKITMDLCSLHKNLKDSYCERCNVCFCNTCYQDHVFDSPGCSAHPISVKEEAIKQKSRGLTLTKKMDDFKQKLLRQNDRTRDYIKELNSVCDSKCRESWEHFETTMEIAKQKTDALCEEIRRVTNELVKLSHHLLDENEKMLKQLEIWHINLQHLLYEFREDVGVVCGVRSLESRMSSRLHKIVETNEKPQLEVTFADWWLQTLDQVKTERIGLVSPTGDKLPTTTNIVIDKQVNLPASNIDIHPILINKEDNHIFFFDETNKSMIEYSEWGELVCECLLSNETNEIIPVDMCSISQNIFVVVCGWKNKLIFLERRNIAPFLKIKKIIGTEESFCSVCQMKDTIIACDYYFQIDSFTKEGEKVKTILPGASWADCPRIYADPSSGEFWGTKMFSSEVYCYNLDGEEIRYMETQNGISDFCVDKMGYLYFCNEEGFFSLAPKNISYKFDEASEEPPRISVIRNRIFICIKIQGKYSIKVFKILE